jgi:acetolactate synthase-1/2/3 large subunit
VPTQSSPAPRGADLVVRALVDAGVERVFGLPGDTGVALYDALHRGQDRIRHVLARDERHAAYMADGYARSANTLGVCEASSGGGVSYLASGLAEAFSSSVPILVITSDVHRGSRGTSALTEIDQLAIFSGCTKWRRSVESAAEVPAVVAEAVRQARSGRPAPVAVVIPEDVLDERVQDAGSTTAHPMPVRPSAAPAAVDEAVELLSGARTPVLIAGGGVHLSSAYEQVVAVCERAALPVATTIHGKGAVDESHPLSLGVVGANGAREFVNSYVEGADVALFVGTRANATDTNSFTAPPRGQATVIQIDIEPDRAGRNYPGSLGLVGDAATVLGQIEARLPRTGDDIREDRIAELSAERQKWERQIDHFTALPDGLLEPREVVRTLHELFGPDAFIVGDPGTPTPNIAAFWPTNAGARRVIVPRGHGPMGYAIPAAIGVAVAHPGNRVLCLTTEGSLGMAAGDWETAVRLRLPITYVLLDNSSMGWIKMLQHLYEGARYFSVDPGPIDSVGVAAAMGMRAERATSVDHLKAAVAEADATAGPSLIEVRIPDQIASPPPVAPWQATLDGHTAERPVY